MARVKEKCSSRSRSARGSGRPRAWVVVAPLAPFSGRGAVRRAVAPGRTLRQAFARWRPAEWPAGVEPTAAVNGATEVPLDTPLKDGDFATLGPSHGVETLIAIGLFLLEAIAYAVVAYALSMVLSKVLGPDLPDTGVGDNTGKPTYGWDGPRTIYSQGAACALGYGRMQTGGQVLSYYITNENNRSYLNLLLGVSEGEIHSIGGSTEELNDVGGDSIPDKLWVNGVKLKQYEKVRVWTRFGKLQQDPIPGFNDLRIQYPVSQELKVRGPTKSVLYTTVREVSRARLRITWPRGLYVVAGSRGEMYSSRVDFKVRFRPISNGTPQGDWSDWKSFGFREESTAPMWRDYELAFPSLGQWEIELYRDSETTPGAEDVSQYQDDAEWSHVLEIQDRDIRYIRTGLVAIKALATEGLQGARPDVRIEFEGRVVRIWDGSSYREEFSANPWWVVLDMLLNTEYGLGDYLRNVQIDPDEFKDAADEADELIFSGVRSRVSQWSSAFTTTLMVEDTSGFVAGDTIWIAKGTARQEQKEVLRVERDRLILTRELGFNHTREQADAVSQYHERYRFDGVFDEGTDAWEAIQTVAKAARGVVIKLGNRLILKRARASEPGWLVNEGNCRNLRLQYVNRLTQANEWRAQFLRLEEDGLFQPDTMVVQSSRAVLDSAQQTNFYAREGRRTEDIRMIGVTRKAQVRRDLNFRQRVVDNSYQVLSFEAPLELIGTAPGAVFAFAHHVLGIVANGRTLAGVSSGGNTITLDRDVVIGSGTWVIRVRTDADELVERTVTSTAGSYARGATIQISGTWPEDIQARAPYALGIQGEEVREYEMTKWRFLRDLWIEVEAVNYNEDNYKDEEPLAA